MVLAQFFFHICLHNCSKLGGLLRHKVVTTTRKFFFWGGEGRGKSVTGSVLL